MSLQPKDHIAPPCSCPECYQAGVTKLEQRRDPYSGKLLHGYPLRRWYEAREQFRKAARKAVGAPGRHGSGFERLVNRDPGQEG